MRAKWDVLRFLRNLGYAGAFLISSALAAPPSRAFLEIPGIYRLLRQAGVGSRDLARYPDLQRALRTAEIDYLWRARLGQRLSEGARLALALERSGLEAMLYGRDFGRRGVIPLTRARPYGADIRVDPRGSLYELLRRYEGLNRPSDFLTQLEPRPWTVREVVDEILIRRSQLVDELQDLADEVAATTPALASEIRRSAERISVSQQSLGRLQSRHRDWISATFRSDLHDYVVGGYGSVVPGELGELLVFARESNARARGVPADRLARVLCCGYGEELVRRAIERLQSAEPQLFAGEIDIFFDGMSAFGEVKTLSEVMTLQNGSFEGVLRQAQATVRLRDRLMSLPEVQNYRGSEGIRLRIYFNSGIDQEAREAFESLGFEVFGPGQRSMSRRAG
jgi:hypothetical protein